MSLITKSQKWIFLIGMTKSIQKDTERFMLQAGNWQANSYINFFPVSNWLHFISIQENFSWEKISIQAITVIDLVPNWIQLNVSFTFCIFKLFFSLRVNSNITWFYCTGDKKHCSCTVYAPFTSPTILFIDLKIILLQYFQFSISAKISSI